MLFQAVISFYTSDISFQRLNTDWILSALVGFLIILFLSDSLLWFLYLFIIPFTFFQEPLEEKFQNISDVAMRFMKVGIRLKVLIIPTGFIYSALYIQ